MEITVALLRRFAGRTAKAAILQAIADHADEVLPKYGITTALRLQHFFAQIAHESTTFSRLEENLNYSAKRMTEVWPGRYPTLTAAKPYANNPKALGNKSYGGRMGNQPGTDDGYTYRGRGLAQHTGRDGYEAVAKITGLPLVESPELVMEPEHMLECAAAFWKWKGLDREADRDSVEGVTKRWNGGKIGLADRRKWLAKARKVFTEDLDGAAAAAEETPRAPARPHGEESDKIRGVQQALTDLGYHEVGAVDGKWGGRTAAAIAAFKNDRDLDQGEPVINGDLERALVQAKGEGWKRPIAEARKEATTKDLPQVETVRQTWWSRLGAKILAIPSAVGALFAGVVDNFGDAKEKVQPVVDIIGSVPTWLWLLGVAGVGVGIWLSQRRAEQATVDLYREGRLVS